MEFPDSTVIGRDAQKGMSMYIEARIDPCSQNCEFYPTDLDYFNNMVGILPWLINSVYFLDSSSEYQKYEDSIEKIMSHGYELYIDPFKTITSSIVLHQEIIQTFDGAVFRK